MTIIQVDLKDFSNEFIKDKLTSSLADTCAYYLKINQKSLRENREELQAIYTPIQNEGELNAPRTDSDNEIDVVNLDRLSRAIERQEEQITEWEHALEVLANKGITPSKPKVTNKLSRESLMEKVALQLTKK